jgi:CMP-N-acetylneuraminic acid synthetase
MNIIAVIPARAASKRLACKNIKLLWGKPLLAHTIEDALNARLISRVLVSTDSPEIAKIAQNHGAETPFLRPPEISGDKISDTPVIAHVTSWLKKNEGYKPDILVLLRPTTPFRADDLIDRCVNRLIKTEADSVRSVRNVGHWHPYWMLTVDEKGWSRPFIEKKTIDTYYQSQLLPPLYKHDGYCDILRQANIPNPCPPNASLAGLYGNKRAVEKNDDGYFINIDTLEDFEIAELIFEKQTRKNKQD